MDLVVVYALFNVGLFAALSTIAGGDAVIVEAKSARGVTDVDRALWSLGARPVRGCSKYCLGVGFTRPGLKANRFRPLLRRYFEEAVAEPRAVVA